MIKIFTQHRYLLWQFTKRQIEQRHRGSALGMLWSLLQPLLMMSIYTVVFGLVFKGRYAGGPKQTTVDYALGIFLSITIFQIISDVIANSSVLVLNQPNLVKKVVFPVEILPLANLGAALYQFCISLVLVFISVAFLGQGLTMASFGFVVALLPIVPFAIGLALILSSLGVFLRDIQYLAAPINLVLMYSSAVFYSPTMVPPGIWAVLQWNPLVHIIDQSRSVLLWHQSLQWEGLLFSSMAGLCMLGCGVFCFKTLKPAFADVI